MLSNKTKKVNCKELKRLLITNTHYYFYYNHFYYLFNKHIYFLFKISMK